MKSNVKSAKNRRQKSNQKIKEMGIACFEDLPMIEDASELRLKSLDAICKRAIASLLTIQLVLDISRKLEEDVEEGDAYTAEQKVFLGEVIDIIRDYLKKYQVEDALLGSEKLFYQLDSKPSQQQIINVVWNYEAYWSLVWALGLVDDIEIPSGICDCDKAIDLVASVDSYDEFKAACKLRDIEEILDMLDLHYRYHWACVEKRLNPTVSIGVLNPEVVVERRKGLEWLVSDEEDWDDISLDT